MFDNFIKSYERFRKIRNITYIVVIITMLSVGTYFLIGGKLYARISSVTFPPEVSNNITSNKTYFGFELNIELWNPSIFSRIEQTPNSGFTFDPCIDVTFTNLSGYNSHVVINDIYNQSYDQEYIYLTDSMRIPVIGREVVKPGISTESAFYGMAFNEANLTRLPMGEYKLWMKIRLILGRDVISNAVTLHVFENETYVVYDIISANWGNVSLFRSCLSYYLIGGVMIIMPLVNRLERRKKKLTHK